MAWNRPSAANQQPAQKRGSKAPSKMRGVIAGAVVVVLGALCFFIFSGKDESEKAKSEKNRGLIKEATPAAARTNAVAEVKKPKGPKPIPKTVKRDDNGILRWPSGARYVEEYYHHTNSVNPFAGQKEIFKRPSDVHIATLVGIKPGQMLIGGFNYGKVFDKEFKESLKEKIEFLEDDTPEERQLKEDVIAAREELKEAMARGEKPSEVMQRTRDELVKLAQYRQNLAEQLAAIKNEEGRTQQDILDATEAANLMLKEKGISEFSTKIIKRRIERARQEMEGKQK